MSNYELMKNKEFMSQMTPIYQEAVRVVLTHMHKNPGVSQRKACDELGVNYKRFTSAMGRLREIAGVKNAPPSNKKRPKPRVTPKKPIETNTTMQTFEVEDQAPEKPMVALIGKPQDVMETLRAVFS